MNGDEARQTPHAVMQGRFLVEVSAVQRDLAGRLIARVAFPHEAGGAVTVVADAGSADLPVTADRAEIAAALFPGDPPPGRGDVEGFAVTSPPRAVHAEILHDLGVHSDALSGYLGGGALYDEVRSDGRTVTVISVRDERGRSVEMELSLVSDESAVGVPYTLMERLRDRGR